jgi:uncharacterized membrane protein
MLVGFLGNEILLLSKFEHPLSIKPIIIELLVLIFGLIYINQSKEVSLEVEINNYLSEYSTKDLFFVFSPFVFIIMTIIGAVRLNNGGDGIVTLFMLIFMGIYIIFLTYNSSKLGKHVIETSIFLLSISLLLMTSLRGWYVTGHDIQREYRVFQIANINEVWKISLFQDAYNACMSITILPTIFSKLLGIFDPYIYKIIFQFIFATVPVIVYKFARRNVSILVSLLSAFYFMFFPTFFSDMPFLNRQEIAFLFLSLMYYILFDEGMDIKKRRWIFSFLGVGMVLSHYSTTYTVIVLLLFVIFAKPVFVWLTKIVRVREFFNSSSIKGLNIESGPSQKLVTVWMVLFLVGASFLWTGVFTDTAGGSISRVIEKTIVAIKNRSLEEGKSSAALSYNLFSWGKQTQKEVFDGYKRKIITRAISDAGKDNLYGVEYYSKYDMKILDEVQLPLTDLGKSLRSVGIDVPLFNFIVRSLWAKILQILILVGFVAIVWNKKFIEKDLEDEYVLLSLGSLVFMALIIILPVLSSEYGVMRAFEQSLLFLGLLIVIGSQFIFSKMPEVYQKFAASFLVIFFFFSITGVITQLLGGYGPQMHLNNAGTYYEIYYISETENSGVDWLIKEVDRNNKTNGYAVVQSSIYPLSKGNVDINAAVIGDIYPGVVRRDSYILLGKTDTQLKKASASFNDTNFTYSYPMEFLDENKSLIYSNGEVNIYR